MAIDHAELLLQQMSSERLMAHIGEFSRWTKHAGTSEELESLKYVEEEMRSYGYQTKLIMHDAYISLPKDARVEVLGRTLACNVHSFSVSSPPEGTRGKVVYAGPGRSQNYEGLDVRGCIVLLDGIANPAATIEANRQGAIGQIHISPHEYVHEMCISPVWGSPGDDQLDQLPRTVVVTIPLESGQELKQALAGGKDVEAALFAEVDSGWRKTPILVADYHRPGAPSDDPYILFTGHHDTWYYGVMDNGGANATMLEVSRLCAQHPELWRSSLRVIYWSGHSQGRYSSSSWYADTYWEELEQRALVHVNVDSTGGMGNTVVADTTAAAELRKLAEETLQTQSDQEFSGRRMERAGDQSFWGIGVPAIFGNMSEQPVKPGAANAMAAVLGGKPRRGNGTGWWWHTPYDTADKMDADILVRDTRIYQYAVWRLLTDAILPLDYTAYADDLIETVSAMQEQVAGKFDLTSVLDRARMLRERVSKVNEWGKQVDAERAGHINRYLQELSRILVPLDYTLGDRFSHDPALMQPAVPALRDVAKLAGLDQESDLYKFLSSRLTRERNRIAVGLRDAIKVTDRFLQTIHP